VLFARFDPFLLCLYRHLPPGVPWFAKAQIDSVLEGTHYYSFDRMRWTSQAVLAEHYMDSLAITVGCTEALQPVCNFVKAWNRRFRDFIDGMSTLSFHYSV
jgi:hypothetical protein